MTISSTTGESSQDQTLYSVSDIATITGRSIPSITEAIERITLKPDFTLRSGRKLYRKERIEVITNAMRTPNGGKQKQA